jgi:hypothetical protein
MLKFIKLIIVLVAIAAISGNAWSMRMTEQQVKNVCGSKLESGHGASGCEKKCGQKICMYECGTDKKTGKKTCEGSVLITAPDGAASTESVSGLPGNRPGLSQ